MRVDALHRKLVQDVNVMYDAVTEVLPAKMPKRYNEQQVNVSPFVDRLNERLLPFNCAVVVERDKSIPPGAHTQSGVRWNEEFIPNDYDADVRIVWHLHPKTNRLKMTPHVWKRRRFFFWQLLMHELVHRHQMEHDANRQSRTYRVETTDLKELAELEYFADCDEIEAYSHNAAMEFILWFPNATFAQAKKLVEDKRKNPNVPSYLMYADAFRNNKKHPAWRHFQRKSRAWFDVMQDQRDFYRGLELT